jgi:NAD-dependent dihydropyrimidine dehydrogenase PreA subunit
MAEQTAPRVEIVSNLCKACQRCVVACKPGVLETNLERTFNELGYQWVVYKGDGCNGCGSCFYACPEPGAVIVYKREKVGKVRPSENGKEPK